jgi:hypothetical protein
MIDTDIITKLTQRLMQQTNMQSKPPTRWKYCVALAACGWNAAECERIENDIMVIWRKDGKKDVHIRLSHADQCLWIDYLSQKEK